MKESEAERDGLIDAMEDDLGVPETCRDVEIERIRLGADGLL